MTESSEYQPKKYSRRNFIRVAAGAGLLTIGVGTVGCVYKKKDEPEPEPRFTDSVKIRGEDGSEIVYGPKGYEGEPEDVFQRGVVNMLDHLGAYSREWFEKTLYAGEVVIPSSFPYGLRGGTIGIPQGTAELGGSKNIKQVLSVDSTIVHEGWHVIDQNLDFENYLEEDIPLITSGVRTGFELELRVGIAKADYIDRIKEKYGIDLLSELKHENGYEFSKWLFEEDKKKVDQVKYKDRLDAIDQIYFDHENKELKTDFLDETWKRFKNL